MPKRQIIGACRLCGHVGPLTNEHVPPKAAYQGSNHRVIVHTGEDALDGQRGKVYQRGYHIPVFCEQCNNNTGAWYGREFARWAQWGFTLLDAMRQKDPTNVQAFVGHPLRIAKQVLTTMAAASQPEFLSERRDLVHFLLDRESVATEGQFQLAMYLCPTATGRSTGLAFAQKNNEAPHRLVEFALPPFGYVLTVSGQPLDSRPIDISRFTLCSYATEERIDLASIPILPTHLALPGDYRSADEIRRDVIENILIEQDHPNAASEAVRIMEQGEGQRFFEIHGEDWDKL